MDKITNTYTCLYADKVAEAARKCKKAIEKERNKLSDGSLYATQYEVASRLFYLADVCNPAQTMTVSADDFWHIHSFYVKDIPNTDKPT